MIHSIRMECLQSQNSIQFNFFFANRNDSWFPGFQLSFNGLWKGAETRLIDSTRIYLVEKFRTMKILLNKVKSGSIKV